MHFKANLRMFKAEINYFLEHDYFTRMNVDQGSTSIVLQLPGYKS